MNLFVITSYSIHYTKLYDDVVNAFLVSAERLISTAVNGHEIYGVSSGNPLMLKDLVDIFSKTVQRTLPVEWGGRHYRNREVMLSWQNFNSLPGWRPKIKLSEGIASTYGVRL